MQENVWEHPGKYYLCKSETQKSNIFDKYVCPRYKVFLFSFKEILSISFYIIFYEDEDRKYEDWFNKIHKSLDVNFISIKKNMTLEFGKS